MSYQIKLKHGLYNAGVLGLYNILQFSGKSEYIHFDEFDNHIRLDEEFLDGFENDYFNYLEKKYHIQLTINKLIARYQGLDMERPDPKFYPEFLKFLKDKAKNNSYKSAYEIIDLTSKNEGNPFLWIKDIERDIYSDISLNAVKKVMDYFMEHRHVFQSKDLAYTVIKNYWDSISFFGKANVKKDMQKEMKREFVDGARTTINNVDDTGNYTCQLCHNAFKKKKVNSFDVLSNPSTWLVDQGVDYKRKSSHFWNYFPSEELCGICKLVYACSPAGFHGFYNNSFFINASTSMTDLIALNNVDEAALGSYENIQNISYGKILQSIQISRDRELLHHGINNIQIIRKDDTYSDNPVYRIDYLGERELSILKAFFNELGSLQKIYIKINDKYKNIYTYVIDNILNGQKLYPIIHEALMLDKSTHSHGYILKIIQIQQTINQYYQKNGGRDKTMLSNKQKKIHVMYHKGIELRNTIDGGKDEKNNKLRSFVYQLANALQANNTSLFMDRIVRLYSSQEKEIPNLFLDMLNDENDFMCYGYSFIIGLKGETYKEANNEE